MPTKFVFLVAIAAAVSSSQVNAHHAFAAVFNGEDPVEISGTITKVEWMNPHTWIYVATEDSAGGSENWALEMGSPNGLVRRGWSRRTLQGGDRVNVTGYRAKDGANMASVKNVVLGDGREFSGASSKEDSTD